MLKKSTKTKAKTITALLVFKDGSTSRISSRGTICDLLDWLQTDADSLERDAVPVHNIASIHFFEGACPKGEGI